MNRSAGLLVTGACLALIALAGARPGAAAHALRLETGWTLQTGTVIYGGLGSDSRRLYAGGEDGVVRAIDKATGEVLWTRDLGAGVASSVSADDRRVYFHRRDGVVEALAAEDGQPVWQFATGGERRWDYWDYFLSTPSVDDRQVYFGSGDHHVYALDKRSGALRWKFRTGSIVHGSPQLAGEKVIIGGFDGRLRALDRGNGRQLWSFKTVGNAYFRNGEIPGSATVADGRVYFGGRDYNLYALLEDTGTGAWNRVTPSWIVGQPLVAGEAVIVANSDQARVFSYQAASGRVNWEFQNSYNMFTGPRALGEAHVVLAGLDGRITVLALDDGSLAGRFETEAARANRGDFFKPDGSTDYGGVESLDDLMDLYDRQLDRLGGITGDLVVDGARIYYATASGEIGALDVHGL